MLHPQITNIIGVSKWSCPVCSRLLLILGEGYQVLGSHTTISGCSLPLATPEPILDQMITHFGQQLRDDMKLFMEVDMQPVTSLTYHDQQLQRISSTESQPMSLLSNTSGEGVVVDAFASIWDNIRRSLQQLTRIRPGS